MSPSTILSNDHVTILNNRHPAPPPLNRDPSEFSLKSLGSPQLRPVMTSTQISSRNPKRDLVMDQISAAQPSPRALQSTNQSIEDHLTPKLQIRQHLGESKPTSRIASSDVVVRGGWELPADYQAETESLHTPRYIPRSQLDRDYSRYNSNNGRNNNAGSRGWTGNEHAMKTRDYEVENESRTRAIRTRSRIEGGDLANSSISPIPNRVESDSGEYKHNRNRGDSGGDKTPTKQMWNNVQRGVVDGEVIRLCSQNINNTMGGDLILVHEGDGDHHERNPFKISGTQNNQSRIEDGNVNSCKKEVPSFISDTSSLRRTLMQNDLDISDTEEVHQQSLIKVWDKRGSDHDEVESGNPFNVILRDSEQRKGLQMPRKTRDVRSELDMSNPFHVATRGKCKRERFKENKDDTRSNSFPMNNENLTGQFVNSNGSESGSGEGVTGNINRILGNLNGMTGDSLFTKHTDLTGETTRYAASGRETLHGRRARQEGGDFRMRTMENEQQNSDNQTTVNNFNLKSSSCRAWDNVTTSDNEGCFDNTNHRSSPRINANQYKAVSNDFLSPVIPCNDRNVTAEGSVSSTRCREVPKREMKRGYLQGRQGVAELSGFTPTPSEGRLRSSEESYPNQSPFGGVYSSGSIGVEQVNDSQTDDSDNDTALMVERTRYTRNNTGTKLINEGSLNNGDVCAGEDSRMFSENIGEYVNPMRSVGNVNHATGQGDMVQKLRGNTNRTVDLLGDDSTIRSHSAEIGFNPGRIAAYKQETPLYRRDNSDRRIPIRDQHTFHGSKYEQEDGGDGRADLMDKYNHKVNSHYLHEQEDGSGNDCQSRSHPLGGNSLVNYSNSPSANDNVDIPTARIIAPRRYYTQGKGSSVTRVPQQFTQYEDGEDDVISGESHSSNSIAAFPSARNYNQRNIDYRKRKGSHRTGQDMSYLNYVS